MKKIITVVALSIVISGCASIFGGGPPNERWADYKSWTTLNNQPITGDHTGLLGGLHLAARGARKVYVNDIGAATAQGTAPYKYPVGTIILKEQYSSVDNYEVGNPGVTVMVKVADDAPTPAANWAWARSVSAEPKVTDSFCSGCHTAAIVSDFAFSNADSLKDFQ